MSPVYDVYRVEDDCFLDLIQRGVEAPSAPAAIRNSRARNGRVYVALRAELTSKPRDSEGRIVHSQE